MEILPIFQGEINKYFVPYKGKPWKTFGSIKLDLMGTYLYEKTAQLIAKQINIDGDYSVRIIRIPSGFALYMKQKKVRKPGKR
jgi:hypothetical protein